MFVVVVLSHLLALLPWGLILVFTKALDPSTDVTSFASMSVYGGFVGVFVPLIEPELPLLWKKASTVFGLCSVVFGVYFL